MNFPAKGSKLISDFDSLAPHGWVPLLGWVGLGGVVMVSQGWHWDGSSVQATPPEAAPAADENNKSKATCQPPYPLTPTVNDRAYHTREYDKFVAR